MNKQHWSDLTEEQRATYGNGCGYGNGFFNWIVPELMFKACCRQHDFYYSRGGDWFDKFEADTMFFAHMVKSVNDLKDKQGEYLRWYKKILPFSVAVLYYIGVTILGLPVFGYGKYKKVI